MKHLLIISALPQPRKQYVCGGDTDDGYSCTKKTSRKLGGLWLQERRYGEATTGAYFCADCAVKELSFAQGAHWTIKDKRNTKEKVKDYENH